ncbi:MAG: hypothetical protein ACYC2H_01285 [Thermoplasmatota archaeon]
MPTTLNAQTSYGTKPAAAPPAPTVATNALTGASNPATAATGAAAAPAATATPASGALPAVSTATPQLENSHVQPKAGQLDTTQPVAAGLNFQGIDPNQRRTGTQALDYLNTTFGQPLNEQQRQYAMQFINYTDPTGAAEISGADYNRLMQEAARLSGNPYTAYAPNATTPVDPSQTPYPTEGPLKPDTFEAPPITDAPVYKAPTYEQQTYRPPTYEEAQNDPGYRFAQQQGQGAIEAGAAARGMLGTGTTLRDVSRFNQDLASQQYQSVYNRSADTFDRNAGERRFGYGADVEGAQASYAPSLVTWNARREADQRGAELNFDRRWQRETYGRDDAWRRNRAAESDWQYRDNQAETRRRFLAELGQA